MGVGFQRDYLQAIVEGDRRAALAVVDRAAAAGLSLADIYLDVFRPSLHEVGRLWQRNELSVAEEHVATAITQSAMARLYVGAALPPVGRHRLIAACAEYERHELGLRMLCDLLDLAGWETRYVGAAAPPADLVKLIREHAPAVVALSASIAPHLSHVRDVIDLIRTECLPAPFILVGGSPFVARPELAATVGADGSAADARDAVALLRKRFPS